ncbi:MAG TPA: ribosomal protein L7/L12 [Candidatus Fusicatenibacter intestinigallinarum]|uniref:Ribosomal protein L7/L12 n=1 Tax=Candidatus Fusicatenibacter intestinigallinarum TaxID=2838598 RepID=A0A9D2SMH4_9FIRM|nr:ribosomal protein L7/L12 [Candidatus Fusicatenibacter intestinigallinarum]
MKEQKNVPYLSCRIKKDADKKGIFIGEPFRSFLDEFARWTGKASMEHADISWEENTLKLSVTSAAGPKIQISFDREDSDRVELSALVETLSVNASIPVGQAILSGELIQNHLGLEITLTDAGCGEKNLKMRYVFFVDYESASAAPDCSFYLLSFLEEVNQAVRVLGSGSLHSSCRVRIREAGPSPVMVIKKVFELGGGNLIAARNLVHAAPDAFLYAESREHAETIKKALEAAGAEAELA